MTSLARVLLAPAVGRAQGIEPAEARKRGHPIPDETPDLMRRRWGGDFPFVRATEDTIYDALRLLMDPVERDKWGRRGLAHVRAFHDQEPVVRQLEDIYRRAVREQTVIHALQGLLRFVN